MASSTEKGTNQLTFTFVPAIGTLPSQVSVGTDELPKIRIGPEVTVTQKAESERNSKIKQHQPSESFLDVFHKQRSGDSFSKEVATSNSLEEIKHNDLFIAEFVVVMDSDDGEDEKIPKKKKAAKDNEFIRAQQSTIAKPKAALAEAFANELNDPTALHELRPDLGYQELQQHLYLPTTDVISYRFQSTNLSQSSKGISKYKGYTIPSMNTNENIEDINRIPEPLLSQNSNYFNVSTQNTQPLQSETSQIQSLNTAPGKCIRSNAMSPLPIKIIKHPLCRSPSPLNSQCFGSSSTICSVNDSLSPVPRPEATSRLSFLTSLLKLKKSAHNRTISPDSTQYNFGIKSTPHFYKTAGTSSPPRKSQSCFALNYPKDFKISNAQEKNEKQNLLSSSDVLHSESSFYSRSLRSLSPESILLKSSSGSFFSRKGVVSPLLELPHQSNTILNSSRENIPSLNEKPPLNRQSYTPLKKYSVLGKSRRVTLFPSPLPFHESLSNATSQKQNVMPYVKRYVPDKNNLRPSLSLSENLEQNRARSTSPMEITESSRFPPSYPNTYQLFNEHADSEFAISPSLLSYYTHHFESSEELSRNYSPAWTSPSSILRSPRSNLSRSCKLRSINSLTQSSDRENNQSYKIKSSYKSFAAIPTNTLLRDQKAIDKPEINSTTASKENLDPHQEMCSPALLRQQTEEICAAIDEVLHDDPLPMHCKVASKPAIRKRDSKSVSILRSPQKSAGRETKYASIQQLANTRTNNLQTKPGVIRPILLKISAMETMDGPFDFQQFSMPHYRKET
ncbi:muscular LMNA-interacting protein isoform X2 [Rana temporaria]|uniref:muscular LMNA-interacting protein isoform X2 n=1 Tax=Rana temporaria TaxID=8407 RepID=UPI001AAC974A|nr:muscular LMNA-interacting protein isoform X2 [Rana temporaria]